MKIFLSIFYLLSACFAIAETDFKEIKGRSYVFEVKIENKVSQIYINYISCDNNKANVYGHIFFDNEIIFLNTPVGKNVQCDQELQNELLTLDLNSSNQQMRGTVYGGVIKAFLTGKLNGQIQANAMSQHNIYGISKYEFDAKNNLNFKFKAHTVADWKDKGEVQELMNDFYTNSYEKWVQNSKLKTRNKNILKEYSTDIFYKQRDIVIFLTRIYDCEFGLKERFYKYSILKENKPLQINDIVEELKQDELKEIVKNKILSKNIAVKSDFKLSENFYFTADEFVFLYNPLNLNDFSGRNAVLKIKLDMSEMTYFIKKF